MSASKSTGSTSQRSNRPTAAQTSPSDQQMQERFNQLVAEVRLLEAYYQEVVTRQQNVSAALLDTRAALQAIETLSKSDSKDLLVPVGGGTLIFGTSSGIDKIIVSVGAGIAVEKSQESAKTFLQERKQELERGVTSLENQRKEIGSRLEVGRSTIQRITEASR